MAMIVLHFSGVTTRVVLCVTVIVAVSACARIKAPAPLIPPAPATVSISAGTDLLVRIVEAIDVKQAIDGKNWAAVVSRDVRTPEGELLLGAGSPLHFGVVSSQTGLQLVVRSVVANGNSYLSGLPVTPVGQNVVGLEPWGTVATAQDMQLTGPRIFVPGQALIVVKLGEPLVLR